MAGAVTHSLVHQFASMKPTEFGATIEPKWQVADKLVKEVRTAVEKQQLTPLGFAGIPLRGVEITRRLAEFIREVAKIDIETGSIDVAMHRDDVGTRA